MRVRPVTDADLPELARGLKVVVDEKRWVAVQPPVTEAELEERFWTRIDGVHAIGMWILPGRRGKGGGRMLLEAAIDARPPHVHKIELEVWPHNEAAIGLYERRLGFEREGLRRDHYRRADGELHSSVIMARLFPDHTPPPTPPAPTPRAPLPPGVRS
jgi:GNAT superfamily N-acetyltransferase